MRLVLSCSHGQLLLGWGDLSGALGVHAHHTMQRPNAYGSESVKANLIMSNPVYPKVFGPPTFELITQLSR